MPQGIKLDVASGPHDDGSGLGGRRRTHADHLAGTGRSGGVRFPARGARHVDSQRGRAARHRRHLRDHVSAGLFAQQPVADGADHLDRVRGGRRHRGAGKRDAPRGGRHGTARSRAAGLARNRLHRDVDEHLADRGVHPDSADERPDWPALPRIRHDHQRGHRDFHGGVADHDADAVRAFSQTSRSQTWLRLPRQREGLHPPQLGLQAFPGLGVAPPALGLRDCRHHRLRQRLPVHHRAQGLLPAAGHRTHDGHHHG